LKKTEKIKPRNRKVTIIININIKYKDLPTEIQRMWNVKIKAIPVIIGVPGAISK
jgi:hypothetical protein